MRTQITDSHAKIWLSRWDTMAWATTWPCSFISGKRLYAEFDANGLLVYTVNGRDDKSGDFMSEEFNAITSDHLQGRLNKDHPLYHITVGQFDNPTPANG